MTELQRIDLDLLKEISTLCEKHDIKYYAFGGTCLGAVRHKGYIPWDDDIDIAMPRGEFNKFIAHAHELPEHVGVLMPENCVHFICGSIKVHDKRTTFIENQFKQFPDRYCGVGLDIMPLDGMPEGEKKQKRHFEKCRWLLYFNNFYRNPARRKSIRSRLFYLFLDTVALFAKHDFFYKKYYKCVTKYPFDDSETALHSAMVANPFDKKRSFPARFFKESVLLPFEDIMISCPKDYDGYLSHYYGADYMTPPEKDGQIVHDTAIVDLEKPYTYYVDLKKQGLI